MIALTDGPLDWDVTWTCVDHGRPSLVSGYDVRSGRQTELDTTDSATAVVYLNDKSGFFDPANASSPFYGCDGKQIALQLWDPITETWERQFRGHIDDLRFDHNPATSEGVSILSNVQLVCVGIMTWLAETEMDLSESGGGRVFGDVLPGAPGIVFYEDTNELDGSGFQVRVTQALDDAGIPADWYVVFTGNIDCLEGKYDVGDSPLLVIRDALEAEFPGIANGYEDRFGRFCAHGRKSRFDPDTVAAGAGSDAWDFQRWKAGDGAAITADPTDRAQIRPPFQMSRPRDRVRNVGYAYPKQVDYGSGFSAIKDADKPGQTVVDGGTSIADYGRRVWRAPDLLTKRGTTTGNDGLDETKLFAAFYVANYAQPRTRIEALTLKSIRTNHGQAEATWAMLTRADISDVVDVAVGYPGGEGLSEEFYIEGRELSVRRANPDYDLAVCTYNVSPTAYYGDDVGMLE